MSAVIVAENGDRYCPHCHTNQVGFKPTKQFGMNYLYWCYKCKQPLHSDFPSKIGGGCGSIVQTKKKEET